MVALLLLAFFQLISGSKSIVRFGSEGLRDEFVERRLHSVARNVVRSKVILLPKVRPSLLIGELIEFELFDGEIAIGDVTQSNHHSSESTTWIGNLRLSSSAQELKFLDEDGYFSLSCVKMSCSAHLYISSSKSEYKIEPSGSTLAADGSGTYSLSEIKIPKQKKSGARENPEFHILPKSKQSSLHISPDVGISATVDTDLILDIFVMYTPQAMFTAAGR